MNRVKGRNLNPREATVANILYHACPSRKLKDVSQYFGKETCADCGQPAKFKIKEDGINGTWYYCGECLIGG